MTHGMVLESYIQGMGNSAARLKMSKNQINSRAEFT